MINLYMYVCIYFILSDFHSAPYELVALQHTMLTIGLNGSMYDYSVLGQKKNQNAAFTRPFTTRCSTLREKIGHANQRIILHLISLFFHI